MATNLDARRLENVCRLCLTDAAEAGHMQPIFPIRGGNPNNPASIVNRIFQCTSLKLEPREGIPSTICELCTVRLEDWYAFREQCLGSDEYLRVAYAQIYCGDGQAAQFSTQFPSQQTQQQQQQQQQRPTGVNCPGGESAGRPSPTSSSLPEGSSASLAKRRKSIFEWTLGDGKGNSTDQKVIVELLDDGLTANDGPNGAVKQQGDNHGSYEPIPLADHGGGTPPGGSSAPPTLPADLSSLLEEATWSKEYCARVNSLMVMVNGTRPYKCKICRKLFKSRSNLRRHIKISHSDEVIEGESPPPECYDFGHIHRTGGVATAQPEQQPAPIDYQAADGAVKRKRRSNADPPIVGPYKCHLCPRSFKMPAHLAVHMKTHQRVEEMPPTAFEQQLQQQLLEHQQHQQQQQQREALTDSRRSSFVSRKTDIEPTDIIQLSDDDDDDDDGGGNAKQLDLSVKLDDTRLEEERGDVCKENGKDDDVVIHELPPSSVPPAEAKVKPRRIPAPGTIPPGPLSMKQRYRESMESGKDHPSPPPQQQFPFIVARPKHMAAPVVATSTPPPTPPIVEPGTPAGSPGPGQAAPPSASGPPGARHRCRFCHLTFPREDLLRVHQKTHQGESPVPFRCRWCQKGFRFQQNYMLHVEKQTCRLLNRQGGGAVLQPAGVAPVARPIVANKRAW